MKQKPGLQVDSSHEDRFAGKNSYTEAGSSLDKNNFNASNFKSSR